MECGGQYVMIAGIPLMPELCADSQGYLTQVIKWHNDLYILGKCLYL